MFKCLIHLQLSVMQSDKYGIICIHLHVDIDFEQHHLFKMLLFPVWFLETLSKTKWANVCVFMSSTLISRATCLFLCCSCFYTSVTQLEFGNGETTSSDFIVYDCVSYPEVFLCSIWSIKLFFEDLYWNFGGELNWICRLLYIGDGPFYYANPYDSWT